MRRKPRVPRRIRFVPEAFSVGERRSRTEDVHCDRRLILIPVPFEGRQFDFVRRAHEAQPMRQLACFDAKKGRWQHPIKPLRMPRLVLLEKPKRPTPSLVKKS